MVWTSLCCPLTDASELCAPELSCLLGNKVDSILLYYTVLYSTLHDNIPESPPFVVLSATVT